MVLDVERGVVLAASNARTPLPPASLTKVVTALAAVSVLPQGSSVPVSRRAAGMPRGRVGMVAGETWTLRDSAYALLLASANDAAAALAERSAGSVERFGPLMQRAAARAGMVDRPVLRDPAGLDDGRSVGGGNLISARDLAFAGRALLREPRLAPIVGRRSYTVPRGPHRGLRLVNHNKLLRMYKGAVGLKTGYTRKAGHCLMAAARRGGRTIVVVLLGATELYRTASTLLDTGFAAPRR